jgi:hypothetical protein
MPVISEHRDEVSVIQVRIHFRGSESLVSFQVAAAAPAAPACARGSPAAGPGAAAAAWRLHS